MTVAPMIAPNGRHRPSCGAALLTIVLLAAPWFGCQALLDSRQPSGTCGDGVRQEQAGEECDPADPHSAADGSKCSRDCIVMRCGNGVFESERGEECDDGVRNDNDSDCTAACKKATCGDGLLRRRGTPPFEVCDDGNQINGDGCSPDCSLRGRVNIIGGAPGGRGVAEGIGSVARFGGVTGLATDADERYLYIGDEEACAIRRLHIATGRVETIAGSPGDCGLNALGGGPGAQAALSAAPKRLAVVGDDLFFAEGNLLRRVDLSDPAFRVSQCDPLGLDADVAPSGDPATIIQAFASEPDGSALYLATSHAIHRMPLPCACGSAGATSQESCEAVLLAGLDQPGSTVRDGNGADARFAGILALARDTSQERLFVADLVLLRTLDLGNLAVKIVAGDPSEANHVDGQGTTSARFHFISSLAYRGGQLYAVEQSAEQVPDQTRFLNWGWANVRVIDPESWQVRTVAGTYGSAPGGRTPETDGFGPHARFVEAEAVALTEDTLFIGGGASIRAMSLQSKQVLTAAGQLVGDFTYYRTRTAEALNGTLYSVGRDGLLHVIPLSRSSPVRRVPLCPSAAGISPIVRGLVAVDCKRDDDGRCADGAESGGKIFVADDAIAGICQVDLSGREGELCCKNDEGEPCCPECKETCQPVFTTGPIGNDLGLFWHWGISDLTSDGSQLYLLSQATRQIIRVTPNAAAPSRAAYEPLSSPVLFRRPWGIVHVDSFLYVSDQHANAVYRIDPRTGAFSAIGNGIAKTVDGTGNEASLCHPVGLVAVGRSLFVGEAFCDGNRQQWNGHAVRQIDLDTREVSTLLGPGPEPFVVPGTGRQASVNWPAALTFDPVTRALYAADLWDHVLLRID